MKKLSLFLFTALILFSPRLNAQQPKLVVIIALDQFPYEYITRFQPYFGKNGFNYLLKNGATFTNARYEHAFTKTSPGHAACMTGAYSHFNGIISNRWYDRSKRKVINSVDDESVQLLGVKGTGISPRNLLTYTVGDMLRLNTGFRSKVISVSNKDRVAVLMGGKLGKAFWFDDSAVVTSSYYESSLPKWLVEFNASGAMQQYFGKHWTELNPIAARKICDVDDAPYEQNLYALGKVFPHLITGTGTDRLTPSYYGALAYSPFSTELLFNVVQKAFSVETLGTRGVTDMLCVGVSVTDLVGHAYGPQSHEVFDNALRTDAMLAQFFSFLDAKVGLKNCIIALTSDHGIAPIPEYIKKHTPNADAGRVRISDISKFAISTLDKAFGKVQSGRPWLNQVIETEVYINRDVVAEKGLSLEVVERVLKDSSSGVSPFAAAYTRDEIERNTARGRFAEQVENSFFPERSADVFFILKPYYIGTADTAGTNHGQPYDYDAHVPLIFVGKNFKPGTYTSEVSPIDLAPTLSEVMKIEFPPSREGRVLVEALR